MVILAHIREQRRLSLGSYGRPRMTEELQELGLEVGHRRVGRLMAENAIKAVRTRKYKATTDSNHAFAVAPNLLDRDFLADAPNQKRAGGISYIWTGEGWLYLAVILDLYSRRVIGWAVSDRLKRDLAIRALDMAVALRRPPPGCIHHTDRGSQYCSGDYQKRLKKHGFLASMSGKGNCYDCRRRELLQNAKGRADLAAEMGDKAAGRDCPVRIHQRLLQSPQTALSPQRAKPAEI
jgi:transposase InsO family protein